jgi:hypothetical protein
MRLIELDGRRAGPIDRGESRDLLKVGYSSAIHLFVDLTGVVLSTFQDVAKIVKEKFIARSTSDEFNLMALVAHEHHEHHLA